MADTIIGETLLELQRKEPEKVETPNGSQLREGYTLRVVQWKKKTDAGEENMGGPQLHKQILFINEETGEIRTGKQKGLRKQEWLVVKENFEKVDALLNPDTPE